MYGICGSSSNISRAGRVGYVFCVNEVVVGSATVSLLVSLLPVVACRVRELSTWAVFLLLGVPSLLETIGLALRHFHGAGAGFARQAWQGTGASVVGGRSRRGVSSASVVWPKTRCAETYARSLCAPSGEGIIVTIMRLTFAWLSALRA